MATHQTFQWFSFSFGIKKKKSLQSLHDLTLNYLRPPCPLSVPSLPYSFLTSTLSSLLLFVGAKYSPLDPFTRI